MNIEILDKLYFKKYHKNIPNLEGEYKYSSFTIKNLKEYISLLKLRLSIYQNEIKKDNVLVTLKLHGVLNDYKEVISELKRVGEKEVTVHVVQSHKATLQLYLVEDNTLICTLYTSN